MPLDGDTHRNFLAGPAQIALRARVHAERRRLPLLLRKALWGALGLIGLAALVATFLAFYNPFLLGVLAQMLGISLVAGREAAMLLGYSQNPTMGPGWILATAILADFITLGITLPLVWLGIERLRGYHYVGGVVLSLEKTAVEKRGFLRHWGMYGLVAFIGFPTMATGVFLAGAIGIFSKLPLRRLMIVLGVASIAVNVFWAMALHYTSAFIPREGFWSYIPLVFAAALAILAVVVGVRQRRQRNLFPIVKVQILEKHHIARLQEVGITDGIDILYVNRKILAAKLGIDPVLLGRLQSVAELSMLRTVSPRHAEMLTEVGITSIRELAVAPPELVAAALHELRLKRVIELVSDEEEGVSQMCKQWTEDARIFFSESE